MSITDGAPRCEVEQCIVDATERLRSNVGRQRIFDVCADHADAHLRFRIALTLRIEDGMTVAYAYGMLDLIAIDTTDR